MNLYTRPWTYRDLDTVTGLWRKQTGVMRPLLPEGVPSWLLNQVAGNTFFDREGFLLAFDEDASGVEGDSSKKPLVGLIHATFPPSEEYLRPHRSDDPASSGSPALPPMARRDGIISMMIVDESLSESDQRQVADALLRAAESYFRERHVRMIYGGGLRPQNNPPFWNGFCGAGDAWGVPDDQPFIHETMNDAGYRELRHTAVWRRQLSMPDSLSMELLAAKRHCYAVATEWEPARTWELLTMTPGEPSEFHAHTHDGRQLGRLVMRKIPEQDPTTGQVVALITVHWMMWMPFTGPVEASRQEVILVLLDAAIRALGGPDKRGSIEWILCSDPTYATRIDAAQKLGFEIIRRGTVRRKEIE